MELVRVRMDPQFQQRTLRSKRHGRRGRNRTCNPRIRNPMLYPFELRARSHATEARSNDLRGDAHIWSQFSSADGVTSVVSCPPLCAEQVSHSLCTACETMLGELMGILGGHLNVNGFMPINSCTLRRSIPAITGLLGKVGRKGAR